MPRSHQLLPPGGLACSIANFLHVGKCIGLASILPLLWTLPARAENLTQADAWPIELSGGCRLPDGRIVLVDDESRTACFLWDGLAGHLPYRIPLAESLDDLEAAAADSLGRVYLLTSHSLTKKGHARTDRRHLARLSGLAAGETQGALAQKPRFEMADDLLGPLTGALGVAAGAINLEGLAWYPGRDQLLFGVRSPAGGMVVAMGPVDALFGQGEPGKPVLHRLDLAGRGVRGLDYDSWQRLVWVLAGPTAADTGDFALYLWDPVTDALTSPTVAGLDRVTQPETVVALGPPDAEGRTRLLVAGEGAEPVVLTAVRH
ncbi:MAG TPA: DUF3616 domain-containing protein [Candidatus Udaeobacter sp.]|nr:DUF3616 domain-containing protein [Candidatus Udaeobacter sp.]